MGASIKKWSDIGFFKTYENKSLTIKFAEDFYKKFGEKINVGCRKCIQQSFKKYINSNVQNKEIMKNSTSTFKLKAKYEGIFWKGSPIRNGDLTDKVAKDLLKNHKAGENLFDKIGGPIKKAIGGELPKDDGEQ